MIEIRTRPLPNAYQNTTSTEVKKTIEDLGLRRSWVHLTVSRLGNLSPEKFHSYVRLLNELSIFAEQDGIIKWVRGDDGKTFRWAGTLLKVVPPSLAGLNSINVDKVMETPRAWQEVLRVVYLPEKKKIDLRELVWIQKRFCR